MPGKLNLMDLLVKVINHRVTLGRDSQYFLAVQMIKVMGQLHLIDKVAHNDFKPDNLVIEDQTNHLKAIDFAAVTSLEDNEKLPSRRGTRGYMAPEKLSQKIKYSAEKADIFSLGVSLLILLFLEYPFG